MCTAVGTQSEMEAYSHLRKKRPISKESWLAPTGRKKGAVATLILPQEEPFIRPKDIYMYSEV